MIGKLPNLLSFFSTLSIVFIIIFAFIPISVLADINGVQTNFQKGLDYAKSNTAKEKFQQALSEFKPQEVFKNQRGGYTEEPPQTNHYQGVTQSNANDLEKAAIEEAAKDEDYKNVDGKPVYTPGKTVTEGFKTRPVFKITQNDEYIKRAKLIEANARNVVSGESNKHIDCKNKKLSTCKTVHIERHCNEEVRSIRRVCEKVPSITTYIRDAAYPGCRIIDIRQGAGARCPGGYSEILYADMIEGPIDDDVHICAKTVNAGEGSECLGGYLVSGKRNNIQGPGSATVPKKMHSRIRFSNIYGHGRFLPVSIVNETTGQTLHNDVRFYNGNVVELPVSEDRDQVFRFYRSGSASWRDIGVVILYIDHMYKERVANEPVWQESCRDV